MFVWNFRLGGFQTQDCGGSGGTYFIFKTVSLAYQILVENKNLNELCKRCKKKFYFKNSKFFANKILPAGGISLRQEAIQTNNNLILA